MSEDNKKAPGIEFLIGVLSGFSRGVAEATVDLTEASRNLGHSMASDAGDVGTEKRAKLAKEILTKYLPAYQEKVPKEARGDIDLADTRRRCVFAIRPIEGPDWNPSKSYETV